VKRFAPALAATLLLSGCGSDAVPTPEPNQAPTVPAAPTLAPAPLPPQVADFPVLASKNCVDVAQFYLEAIGGREFGQAALVWDDPVIDAERLEAVFAGYKVPQVKWTEPEVEGAAGSSYCTVTGTLTDAADPAKPPIAGSMVLKRVNDVPGATPDQLRWTLRSSTFVEPLQRSDKGQP
jgi:hypothetical protein